VHRRRQLAVRRVSLGERAKGARQSVGAQAFHRARKREQATLGVARRGQAWSWGR
jgi:hypothetical protein